MMTPTLGIGLPGFFALSGAWLFTLLAPLILFYFLKLKRPTLQIPSLVLWRQVLTDQRVNSPFQKFKRHLSLLLQIIILVLLVLAAMQPYVRGKDSGVRRLPILIDCSASMAALGPPGTAVTAANPDAAPQSGRVSRLDVARTKVREMIDGMLADQEFCLIAFGRTAHRLTGFTNDKRELRQALDSITVEDVPSEIEDALRMAQALARTAPFEKVLLISDGNFPPQANFDLSFTLDYQKLPPAGPNIGITALNARRASRQEWNVFVTVEGAGQAGSAATVELYRNGQPAGSERVVVAKRPQSLVFRLKVEQAVSLEVRLVPDDFDSLGSDNIAYLDLAPGRALWVYAPASMTAYRMALEAMPDLRLFPGTAAGEAASQPDYDLVITDRPEGRGLKATTTFHVGMLPDEIKGIVEMGKEGTSVVDWRHGDALLEHVELADLVLMDHPRFKEGAQEANLENLGYEVLAYGKDGPLILQKHDGPRATYELLFHTDRSTLPYRVGFPVLLSNLVQIATNAAGLAEARANHTGVLPPINVAAKIDYKIETPEHQVRQESSDERGVLAGVSAPRVGRYTLDGGGVQRKIGASLLSTSETSLAAVDQIQFNELSVKASTTPPRLDRNLWPTLVFIAFLVLLLEWWYFNRRAGGSAG